MNFKYFDHRCELDICEKHLKQKLEKRGGNRIREDNVDMADGKRAKLPLWQRRDMKDLTSLPKLFMKKRVETRSSNGLRETRSLKGWLRSEFEGSFVRM